MKITRVGYMDDGVVVPGVLIKRWFRRPVFFSADGRCGWDSQVIYKDNEKNVVAFPGNCGIGNTVYVKTASDVVKTESARFDKNGTSEFIEGRGTEMTRWVKVPKLDKTMYLTKECANCPYWSAHGQATGCTYRSMMECKPFAEKYVRWVTSGCGEWPMDDFDSE